jgi:hypothetical protein
MIMSIKQILSIFLYHSYQLIEPPSAIDSNSLIFLKQKKRYQFKEKARMQGQAEQLQGLSNRSEQQQVKVTQSQGQFLRTLPEVP